MRNPSLLPLICINVSLGQNFIPQSIPSLSAHFCLQGMVGKVALEEYSGIAAVVAEGWSSAWVVVCLCETFLSLGSNACITVCFNNPRALAEGRLSVPLCSCNTSWKIFVCLCVCGLKGGFCRFHFILGSALPWWGSCFYSFCRNSGKQSVKAEWSLGSLQLLVLWGTKRETFLLWQLLFIDLSDFQRSTMIY